MARIGTLLLSERVIRKYNILFTIEMNLSEKETRQNLVRLFDGMRAEFGGFSHSTTIFGATMSRWKSFFSEVAKNAVVMLSEV